MEKTHRLRTPPSKEALRHSGADNRRCTSATVTLYLEVELSRERRPGTEQKMSLGEPTPEMIRSLLSFLLLIPENQDRTGSGNDNCRHSV